MVFAYITAYLVLFCTAWGRRHPPTRATALWSPAPAIIAPRVHMDEGLSTRQTLTAMGLGAVGALALSRIAGLARRGR